MINGNKFTWNDGRRFYEFKGNNLNFSLKLKKEEVLRNVKIEETVIIPNQNEININRENINEEYDLKKKKENKKLQMKFKNYKDELEEENRDQLIKLYEEYRKVKRKRFCFYIKG